jgi:hypothetical protein
LLTPNNPFWEATSAHHDNAIENAKTAFMNALGSHLVHVAEDVNRRIDAGDFTLSIARGDIVKGKQTYRVSLSDPSTYFISRQIEHNLRTVFDVSPANRNLMSEQVLRTLEDETSKLIVRSDIRRFYESVPHARLLELVRNSGISRTTFRFVEALLESYRSIASSTTGLPRGIGVSAVLAEIYLSELDGLARRMPDVLYYGRYVDDFIFVFGGAAHHPDLADRRSSVNRAVKSLGLSMNASKTKYVLTANSVVKKERLTFLGYQFELFGKSVQVDISSRRLARYKSRLRSSFEKYVSGTGTGRAGRLLVRRLQFLTGNTRLSNNKRNALIGVYFSNSLLPTATKRLHQLDKALATHLDHPKIPAGLRARLAELTFVSGFDERRFSTFTVGELERIVGLWKHAEEA